MEVDPKKIIDQQSISFCVSRFSTSKSVWVDNTMYPHIDTEEIYEKFVSQFSYAIRESECFDKFCFDITDSKLFQAERYGGAGVGDNGGGVRCGNYDGFQIKGIGTNPLVGSGKNRGHSYGGLCAEDAVYELIYTKVLEKLLPIGVAKIYGVILTTNGGAYRPRLHTNGNFIPGWGALLVREICLRPGHFLRAHHYKPRKNNSMRIPPDVIRLRSVNKSFFQSFNNTKEIIMYLGKFLQNCANQFAFARVARLMHTGIAASNICFDGRWIDLTNASFIRGGENIGGVLSFYEEPPEVIKILREFTDTLSKYNNIDLNINPLINYYSEQFVSYFSYHTAFLFAIDYSKVEDSVIANEYKFLVEQTRLIIGSGKMVTTEWAEKIRNTDPVVAFVKGLFLSLGDMNASAEYFNLLPYIPSFNAQTVAHNFKKVVDTVYVNSKVEISYLCFVSATTITALKRTLFAEYFYKLRLDKQIELMLNEDPVKGSRKLIDDSIAIAEWVFSSDEDDYIYLFKSNSLSIYLDKREHVYCYLTAGNIENITDIPTLISKLKNLSDELFLIQNYNFKVHILSILTIVKRIEINCAGLV